MRSGSISIAYRSAVEVLATARAAAGLSQRALATRLGKPPSYVAKVEMAERRLDFLEFIELARALGRDPGELLNLTATQSTERTAPAVADEKPNSPELGKGSGD